MLAATGRSVRGSNGPGRPGRRGGLDRGRQGWLRHVRRGTASKVWHTLDDGRLTEVFYPDLGTPSVRTLDFVVSDGKTFAQRDSDAANRSVELLDSRSLTYRQVNAQPGRFRVTKTYVDRSRAQRAPGGRALRVADRQEARLVRATTTRPRERPHGRQRQARAAMRCSRATPAARCRARSSDRPGSYGRRAATAGRRATAWEDLRDFRMDAAYTSAPNGNVVQTARTTLTGVGERTAAHGRARLRRRRRAPR